MVEGGRHVFVEFMKNLIKEREGEGNRVLNTLVIGLMDFKGVFKG